MTEKYLDADSVRRLLGDAAAGLPQTGDVVAGKYRIQGTIGAGGVAEVLEAHHELLDKVVALKLLAPQAMPGGDFAALSQRFLAEARAAAKIESPHVARVMDVGTLEGGAPFIVMERLEGCNLEELLLLEQQLSVADTVDYVLQALQGLAHAHVLGVVHRDLKPANLFLARQPDGGSIIKILDFGIAMLLDDAGRPDNAARLTGSGVVVGSPLYMSPEQVRNDSTIDQRTDIWSIGVVLCELLTGKVPFGLSAVGMGELFAAILEEPLVPISERRPDAPKELDAVIAKCLARDPADRYADVSQVARALAPFGSGKWAHLQDSIEQAFRARLARMSGPEAFAPTGAAITISLADTQDAEPAPAAPTPARSKSRTGLWVLLLLLVAAGTAWAGYLHAHR